MPPGPEHIVVQELPISEIDRTEHILRMEMICGRAGNAIMPGDTGGHHLDYERLLQVHYIGPLNSFFYNCDIRLRKGISVRLYEPVKHRNVEIGQDIIRLRSWGFMVFPRKDSHILAGFAQIFDRPSGGCGKAVPGCIEIIYDKENFHADKVLLNN